jgi:hypothetical protein
MIELYTLRRVNANRASLVVAGRHLKRGFDGRLGKTSREIPFRSQSAEKLGKNYQGRKDMSTRLT